MYRVNFFFFFSSRRRHTRCSRDWSSDVCSSDLGTQATVSAGGRGGGVQAFAGKAAGSAACKGRSEERRVGKSVDLGGRRIIKKKKRKRTSNALVSVIQSIDSYETI